MLFTEFEKFVIRELIGEGLDEDILRPVLESVNIDVEFTGAGYFASVTNELLPLDRRVFSTPMLVGRTNGIEVGFVVFIEKGELTLDCYGFDDGVPNNIRQNNVVVSAT